MALFSPPIGLDSIADDIARFVRTIIFNKDLRIAGVVIKFSKSDCYRRLSYLSYSRNFLFFILFVKLRQMNCLMNKMLI